MRSVIKVANAAGVTANVAQQFEVGRQILGHGLVPIIEPEVDINSPSKAEAEALLKARASWPSSTALGDGQQVMLKLTLPEADGFYTELVQHPSGAAGRGAVRRLQPRRGQRTPRRATPA